MRLIKTLSTGIMLFITFYLIGAFAQASFDISNWGSVFRKIYSICCGSISTIISYCVYAFYIDPIDSYDVWLAKRYPNSQNKAYVYKGGEKDSAI